MRLSLFGLAYVVAIGHAAKSKSKTHKATDCKYSLEILQVQDGSSSFAGEINNMANFMAELTEDLRDIYGEFKFGVSSFVDKPIPLRGYGTYGNWDYAVDYCYRDHAPLTEENAEIIAGLRELASNLGSGNDFPENPMEALIFAAGDEAAGWSPVEVTHSPSGRPIVRMIMLVTDDIPHFPTDAEDAIARFWNWPRSYNDPSNPMISSGGFGAHNFYNIPSMATVNTPTEDDVNEYLEMADLFAIYDNHGDLDSKQADRLDALIAKFGPYPFPDVVPHPGDTSIPDCRKTEYPSIEAVSKYLRERNTNLIFLVTEPPSYANELTRACRAIGMSAGVDCLVELYKGYAEEMGIAAVVASIDGDNTKDRILESIVAMTDMMCLATTPAPATTTTPEATTGEEKPGVVTTTEESKAPTTEEAKPSPVTTEEAKPAPATTEAEPTRPGIATTEDVVATDRTKTAGEGDVTTGEGNGGGVGIATTEPTTTEEEVVIVPPVNPPSGGGDSDDSSGPNIGVIAGAAAGGAAAAVIGGLLYAKFGTGIFGGGAASGAAATTQVETPENPVERETVEEVTMDMFQ